MDLSDNLKTYLLNLLNSVTLPIDQADLAVELKEYKDSLTTDVQAIEMAKVEAMATVKPLKTVAQEVV